MKEKCKGKGDETQSISHDDMSYDAYYVYSLVTEGGVFAQDVLGYLVYSSLHSLAHSENKTIHHYKDLLL